MRLPGYADLFREIYSFEQEHRTIGSCDLFRIPRREAGNFSEPAVNGPSLQISLSRRPATARADLGEGRFTIPLNRPTFIVGAADVPCLYEIPQEIHLLILEFNHDRVMRWVTETGHDVRRLHDRSFHDPLVINTVEQMWRLCNECSAIEADTLVAALWTLLVHCDTDNARLPAPGGLASWQERRTTEYLADNLADDVSLDTLAGVAGLSTFHFARQFKHSVGLPPHAYLRRLRCERAKEMLTATDLPVTEIAAQVGYETPQAFARMFRAEVGASPSDYRRERKS